MKVTTTYKSNSQGRGQVVAVATIGGKKRQKTSNFDQAKSTARNHGEAAGNLLLANALDTITGGLSRDAVDNATHDSNDSGTRHTFSFPV